MSEKLSCASRPIFFVLALVTISGGAGCSSSSHSKSDGGAGPVTGVLDTHCMGVTPIVLDMNSCNPPLTGVDAAAGSLEFGETIYNAEGDDDDCKYHVKFTVTPAVTLYANVTFKLTLTKKADNQPATGGVDSQGNGIDIEAYLADNNTHVLPNTTPMTKVTETPAASGVYTITPVKFDAAGRWVVRFHLYGNCSDALEDSPHGHVAFYFDVP
jgi:hypothetical protein